ncbi:MAG: hypothetical protein ACE5I7_14270 [Candidatus Binatia bacterium]
MSELPEKPTHRGETDTGATARRTLWRVWLPIPVLIVLLDALFNVYFWKIPKLTPRSVDFRYQFLFDVHHLSANGVPGTIRVLAFGSSIAQSFDPYQVENLLNAADHSVHVRVHRVLVPGIKPSDYYIFFKAEQATIQPDVAVILLNLVDFVNPSFERDLKPQIRYVLPPLPTLLERHAYMATVAEELDLVMASLSNLYRYRKLIRSCLQDHVKLALHWLGARPSRAGYGLYPDGYTKQRFGLPVDHLRATELRYYVAPEWIRQRGRIALEFSVRGRTLVRRVETRPGWKTVRLQLPAASAHILDVKSDSAWNPRAAGLDTDVRLLGVRLSDPLPSAALKDDPPPLTYPPVDGHDLGGPLRMGGAVGQAFVDRWKRTIGGNTAFAKRYRAYRQAELDLCRHTFKPTGEYAAVKRLVAHFSQHGTAVVLVNNPESPLLLKDYQNTPYYQAHVDFFRQLAQSYPHVHFYDLGHALPPEDFNDWHHINYIGTIKLGPFYEAFIQRAVSERKGRQRQVS